MKRIHVFSNLILILCVFFFSELEAGAQIHFDAPSDSTTPFPSSGIQVGGSSPFEYSPPGAGRPNASERRPPYSSPGAYTGWDSPEIEIQPGMTLQEIQLLKAEAARRQRIQRERAMKQMQDAFKLQKVYDSLLDEFPTDLRLLKQQAQPQENTLFDSLSGSGAAAEEAKPELTEEEQFREEMDRQREAAERIQDEQRKKRELEILEKQEKKRESIFRQRAEAERGARLFELPLPLRLRDRMLQDGWCNLFDGKTFFGWRAQENGQYGGGRFTIENGEICSDPRHPGLLYTTNQFGDMRVAFEFQTDEDAEAFLLLRTSPDPRDLYSSCYTVVLNTNHFQFPTGTVVGRQRISLEQLQELEKSRRRETENDDETPSGRPWHRMIAHFDGARLTITVDGNEPITLLDTKPLGCGYLGFLVAKGKARFRNIVWAPGSSLTVFNPVEIEKNWRYNKEKLDITTTRSLSMQISGGPGVVELKESLRNFVLQLEYNISFTSAKTGLFFRSIPRKEQSGYPVSLQNFPTRQDRDASIGVDAGSFFGLKNGRYIRAQDQKWNYLTLSVVDRQFQTWINGVPVCEFSDRRPVDGAEGDRPFLEPGTLQLWTPETETRVQFRNIRIMKIEPRHEKKTTFEDRTETTWERMTEARRERERNDSLDEAMSRGQMNEKTD